MSDAEYAASLACFNFEATPLQDDGLVITCRRVWEEKEPVRFVSHEFDDAFQFLCDGNEHFTGAEMVRVHARHIFDQSPEQLNDFTYLRKGCYARHIGDETWALGELEFQDD